MKGNKKRFLALGLAVLMAGSPVAHLQAAEGGNLESISQETVVEPVQEEPASDRESLEHQISDNQISENEEKDEAEEKVEEEKPEEESQKDSKEEETNPKEVVKEEKEEAIEGKTGNLPLKQATVQAIELNTDEQEKAEKKSYTIKINAVLKDTGAATGMYAMGDVVATKQNDGTYLIRMQQTRKNRNYMALTEDKAAATNHTVDWYVSDANFYYTIPVTDLSQPLYVCFSSTDQVALQNPFSNIVKVTFDVSSMTETNEREVSSADIRILPAIIEEADYTSVDAALKNIPEDLTIYTEDTVSAVKAAKEAVVRGYDKNRQDEVDKMAADINVAVAGLVKKEIIEESELQVNNTTGMFRVVKAEIKKAENGSLVLAITLSGKSYQNLFVGTYEQAVENGNHRENWIAGELVDGKYCFMIPISGSETSLPVVSISNTKLKDYESGKGTLERAFYPRQFVIDYENKTLTTGDFDSVSTLVVTNEVKMFSVAAASLETVGGPNSNNYEEILHLTMGSDSFDKIYIGDAESAAKADDTISIENRKASVVVRKNKTGGDIDFDYLEKELVLSFHSVRKNAWYERAFTVSKRNHSLLISEVKNQDNNKPGTEDTSKDNHDKEDGKHDSNQESGYDSDLTGGTARVDSSTTLKDGVYTPDQFSWSGGTGKVSISCNKITIKNGQAYATIVFSSGHYSYVKANGNIYYGTNTGSTSTFVIPVQLNKNNTIIGMTTAMSAAHEIAYNLFIYLAAAGTGEQGEALNNQKLDQKAPVIMGLTYEEEIEMEYTKYVKLYRYENDIMLLEVDMKTDTEREVLEEETENLYEGNVVKYLIVPEDVEIPAGLDKNVIIIQRPLEKVFVADEDIRKLLKEELEIDEELLMEGDVKEPDYKEMVKNKCNLAILPSTVLDKEKDGKEEKEQLLDLSERFGTLQIPVFVDRMADEEKEEAKLEWLKVYGVLFDCEEKANEVYTEKLAELKATEKKN